MRSLLVVQDKGGSGKSLVARGIAEAASGTAIIEIDSTRRLIELGDRVQFFPVRVDHTEIEKTKGKAARAEFDPVINALGTATTPTLVDVGANTARTLLGVMEALAEIMKEDGIELGVLVVVTADPGALSEAPRLIELARNLGAKVFVLENQLHGPVQEDHLKKLVNKETTLTRLEEHAMEDEAETLLQGMGLAGIPRLDQAKLRNAHGLALGARIQRDLVGLRAAVMTAVTPAAAWLVEEE